MEEIIKHLGDLNYEVCVTPLDLDKVRDQLGVLVGLVKGIAIKIKELEERDEKR